MVWVSEQLSLIIEHNGRCRFIRGYTANAIDHPPSSCTRHRVNITHKLLVCINLGEGYGVNVRVRCYNRGLRQKYQFV